MSQGFDPQALLAQALEMQQKLMEAQDEAADQIVEGSAGGGKVKITMTGGGEVTAVRIDPSVVVADEVDLLEDLVLAAFHDAFGRVAELAQSQMGFDLGGLGELFSGGGFGGILDANAKTLDAASHDADPDKA
jgi:DNA-binding YbaB/EbfC family protein